MKNVDGVYSFKNYIHDFEMSGKSEHLIVFFRQYDGYNINIHDCDKIEKLHIE
jgi:hypothetical protein